MDSDDDEDKAADKEPEDEAKVKRRKVDDSGEEEEKEEDVEVSVDSLDQVQSFGRMMMLAPALQKQLRGGKLGPLEIMAACRALARTKFFDGDINEDLFKVLASTITADKLDVLQTNDVIFCLKTLNAYDRKVLSAVARSFKSKTSAMDAAMRAAWLEVFKAYKHEHEPDFLQLLEVPPLLPTNPSYRRIRCFHFSRGNCTLGTLCTYSHDSRAPLSLADGGSEDWWRSKPLVMTQNQKTMGAGVYGH